MGGWSRYSWHCERDFVVVSLISLFYSVYKTKYIIFSVSMLSSKKKTIDFCPILRGRRGKFGLLNVHYYGREHRAAEWFSFLYLHKSLISPSVIADHQWIGSNKPDMFPAQRSSPKSSAEDHFVACWRKNREKSIQIVVVEKSDNNQSKFETKTSPIDFHHQYAGKLTN